MCSGASAVLIVGLAADPRLQTHLRALRDVVLPGLPRPAVFAVGDARDVASLCFVPRVGRAFRALGLVAGSHVPRPPCLPESVAYRSILAPRVRAREFAASGGKVWIKEGARLQWHKVREAWRLMEADEASSKELFELVVKLRFDAMPLEVAGGVGMDRVKYVQRIHRPHDITPPHDSTP
ncbi:hypothetical protein AB1Y20_018183 [Prymnesium parvum]|uniref:Uncharacterized protein n=1 Tax=Prymnesium parvum TaxID=97485 RepID=A0AB34JQS2_PRYPA